MRLSAVSLLALACAVNAAVLPQPVKELNDRAVTGYKNVAYYVNWVNTTSVTVFAENFR